MHVHTAPQTLQVFSVCLAKSVVLQGLVVIILLQVSLPALVCRIDIVLLASQLPKVALLDGSDLLTL